MANLKQFFLTPEDSLQRALQVLEVTAKGIVLIVDNQDRLQGVLTDGDIRRALLAGVGLGSPVRDWMTHHPMTCSVKADTESIANLMTLRGIRQVPIVDDAGRVVDVRFLEQLDLVPDLRLRAVIMAGGFGARLRPLTDNLPKPMLPVGDRPLMELIINQLHRAGIRRVTVATYYQPEKIKDHFGDGRTFGVEIEYLTEETPLGTAGALGLLDDPQEPLLVINGDLLTQIDFRAMMAFHHEQAAGLTIAVRHYDLQVPYGVLDCEGPSVRRVREKPMLQFVVNAGIYLLEPWALQYIPRGQRFDMTHLIESLLENERPVASFPVLEYWLDIGQHADYEQAQKDMQDGKRGLGAGGRS